MIYFLLDVVLFQGSILTLTKKHLTDKREYAECESLVLYKGTF